jgi:hypothetical protein
MLHLEKKPLTAIYPKPFGEERYKCLGMEVTLKNWKRTIFFVACQKQIFKDNTRESKIIIPKIPCKLYNTINYNKK